jgi:hypothetical protein
MNQTGSLLTYLNAPLFQPAPDVFYSFEDVIVMADGQIIYHGTYSALPHLSVCTPFPPFTLS